MVIIWIPCYLRERIVVAERSEREQGSDNIKV